MTFCLSRKQNTVRMLAWASLFSVVVCLAEGRTVQAGCGDYLIPLGSPTSPATPAHRPESNTPWDLEPHRLANGTVPCHGPNCGQSKSEQQGGWGIVAPPRPRTQSTLAADLVSDPWARPTLDWRLLVRDSRCDYETTLTRLLRPPRVL